MDYCLLLTLLSLLSILYAEARDCHTSWRRAWRDLACEEQDEFLDAITLMKASGIYDDFVYTHYTLGDLTHGTAEFLPWHR